MQMGNKEEGEKKTEKYMTGKKWSKFPKFDENHLVYTFKKLSELQVG
jgi:hypothetical protein